MHTSTAGEREGYTGTAHGLSHDAILAELDRILVHDEFLATHKMREFLRFVVEEALAGRADKIKGFTVAVAVFGRDESFDPTHDPVVRIQAGRLRRALERYYLVAGGSDPVRISIPKGGYAPEFTRNESAAPNEAAELSSELTSGAEDSWPSLLICPFRNLTGDSELTYLGQGLATELCIELSRYPDMRVMMFREGLYGGKNPVNLPQFTIDGNIRANETSIRITIQLFESSSGEQLWVESFTSSYDLEDIIQFEERIANIIAAHVASNQGIINQTLAPGARLKPVANLTSYQAILKGYAYDQAISPESYRLALDALKAAVEHDPQCGLCAGILAFLYADNIAFEFLDLNETPREEALDLAQQGVILEPNSQLNRLALAVLSMLNDDLDHALAEAESAFSLNPNSLLYMELIGYYLSLLGEWDRGIKLIKNASRLNPFYRVHTRYAMWANYFRLQDYASAWRELEHLIGTGDFWYPLARAATAGQLGRVVEGRNYVDELLVLKPNFPERGRVLIRHGIKFDNIAGRIHEGLERSGLQLL